MHYLHTKKMIETRNILNIFYSSIMSKLETMLMNKDVNSIIMHIYNPKNKNIKLIKEVESLLKKRL